MQNALAYQKDWSHNTKAWLRDLSSNQNSTDTGIRSQTSPDISLDSKCGSPACEQEIQDLKTQVTEAWKQRMDLHQENQRLQTCLDLRNESIAALRQKTKSLKLSLKAPGKAVVRNPSGNSSLADQFERYKFEDEGSAIVNSLCLKLQPSYFSDPEPVTNPGEYANISKSTIIGGAGGREDKHSFVMEISDLEDNAQINTKPLLEKRTSSQSGKPTLKGQGSAVQPSAGGSEQHTESNTPVTSGVRKKRRNGEEREEDDGEGGAMAPSREKRKKTKGGTLKTK
ncbi:hypothetical protein TWF132_000143 [Orbilia oligospora]|nr:hypothetical protein TWF132_000143 [Orbilia oligospora]